MRKRLIITLAVANAALFGLTTLAFPQVDQQPVDSGIKPCCKKSVEAQWFCCSDCCTFVSNCKTNANCAN